MHPDTKQKYRELCEEAGWELTGDCFSYRGGTMWYASGLWIFKSKRGRRPVPVQTDAEIEKATSKGICAETDALGTFVSDFLWMPRIWRWSSYLGEGWYESWTIPAVGIARIILLAFMALRLLDLVVTTVWYHRVVRNEGMLPATPRPIMYGRALSLLISVVPLSLWLIGSLLEAPHKAESVALYFALAIGALFAIMYAIKGFEYIGGTKRRKKAVLLIGGICLVCLMVVGLLDWKGPWKYASGGGTAELTEAWRQKEIAGQPVVTLDDVGIEYARANCKYENGFSPVGELVEV